MAKYHLSSDGNPRVCTAAEGNCPLGGDAPHFHSKVAARAAFEASVDVKVLTAATKKRRNGEETAGDDPRFKLEKPEIETVRPPKEYVEKEVEKTLSQLKPGNSFYDDAGNSDLIKITSVKHGSKNSNIVGVNGDGKERKFYLPKDTKVISLVQEETSESAARTTVYYKEENLETALKNYQPRRAKAAADLMMRIQSGYSAEAWQYTQLMEADASDSVYADFEKTVDMVKGKIDSGAPSYEDEVTPYSRAFKILEEEYTKDILRNAARGESNSTSDVSNITNRIILAAKADFLENIRWGF